MSDVKPSDAVGAGPVGERSRREADVRALIEKRLRRQADSSGWQIPRRRGEGPVPLSYAQERLWFLDRLEPGNFAYNVRCPVRWRGRLDVAALAAALAEVVRRHEALRTTFAEQAGGVVQVVGPPGPAALSVIDLGAVPPASREREPRRLLEAEVQRPFDLERGPLVRVVVVSLAGPAGEEEHALLATFHHIVSDGWSTRLFLSELTALYDAARAGGPSPLPELPIQYADFAVWQREWLSGPVLGRQLDFWRRQMAGAAEVLELPTDRPRPAVQTVRGGMVSTALPEATVRATAALCHQGTTRYMVLLAAFEALLWRYTGQDDVLVGSPIAGRVRPETERLIGMFVNTLVMRGDLAGAPSFRGLLDRVREVALEAFAHQDMPFERLVEELRPQRDLSRAPLFQVMFVLHNMPPAALSASAGRSLQVLEVGSGAAQFDLSLVGMEGPSGLRLRLEYNRDLFDAVTVRRMLEHYAALLAGALAEPDRPISGIELLPPGERHQVLVEWNDSRVEAPPGGQAGVCALFAATAGRAADAVAAVCGEASLTYGELDRRSDHLAGELAAAGVGPEVLVALLAERGLLFLTAILAVWKAGGAYLPLDPGHPARRLAQVLEQSAAPLVLAGRGLLPPAEEALATMTGGARPRLAVLEDLPADPGRGAPRGASGRPEAAHEDAPRGAPRPSDGPQPSQGWRRGDLAYVIYTSGSTGVPKGAMVEERGMLNHLQAKVLDLGLTADDVVAQTASQTFDISVWQFLAALLVGGRVHVVPPAVARDPRRMLEQLAAGRVTIFETVPSLLGFLIDEAAARGTGQLAALRWLIPTGEALPPDLCRRWLAAFPGVPLLNAYGPTECSDDVAHQPIREAPGSGAARVPIGRPVVNVRLHLVDRQLAPVPLGAVGELAVGGIAVGRGYLGAPRRTAAAFVPDPFGAPGARLYRTGDLARRRPAGALEFLGRIDHQVKVRGFRIELAEIESALVEHPGVREAAVVVHRDPGGELLTAYVVPSGDGHAGPAAGGELVAGLKADLRSRLPEYMVPAAFVVLPALPLSPNGKLDRRALPHPAVRAAAAAPVAPARSSLERSIAGIWQEVLGLPAVGVHENFFDLGGHSLLVLKVQRRLREELGHDLALVDFFKHPTVGALAAHLGEAAAPAPEPRPAVAPVAGSAVAVIGMAGRFPGAASVDELWEGLCAGRESISVWSEEELLGAGVGRDLLADPRYVRARGLMAGADLFDAAFFDCPPREAEILDPQQRVFLESAWHALEDAGYDALSAPGRVGVFAGSSENRYAANLYANRELVRALGAYQISIANKTDYLPTRVSYKLHLTGPSVNVQTACSTSLVAVHLACRSLLAGECDMALAGGVSVTAARPAGYLYEEGGVASPDGRCRAFDAAAAGMVGGTGVGVVVLKRLADALADGDHVEAVIRGSAINNDGARKVGFTAPGVDGQAQVITAAHQAAGVHPETIGYVEAHGTGTRLGDPIEIAALTQAFRRAGVEGNGRCAVGSLKTNIGHLDAAAGVAGLIKAVLCVKHGVLPPSLHFREPNPELDLARSPFHVNAELHEWRGGAPRRAGVSSFGIGGTNAHAVLEEPPPVRERPGPAGRPWQLLVLSAKSPAALAAASTALAAHLEGYLEPVEPGASAELADVAFTLQAGRRAWAHRRAVVCRDRADAVAALRSPDPETGRAGAAGRPVAFLFPGQGAQRLRMGAELYESEPAYREAFDRVCGLLEPELGLDVKELLHVPVDAPAGRAAESARRLAETAFTQPALFAVEYALASLWMAWGVRPAALLGHSVGEYAAACLAGVFPLADAVRVVAARGRLVGGLPVGAMLALALPEAEATALLGSDLSLAAVNGPAATVVSGPEPAVAALEVAVAARGVEHRRLDTSHAFHSRMLEPVLDRFRAVVTGVPLAPPRLPYVSNLTGTWITAAEATDPDYYVRHLCSTVRFAEGLGALLDDPDRVLLEVGPGRTLASLAGQHPKKTAGQPAVATLPPRRDGDTEPAALLAAAGRLWTAGVDLDWPALHAGPRRRVRLPGYPFERRRYWVAPGVAPAAAALPAVPTAVAGAGGPEPVAAAERNEEAATAPRTPAERQVAEIWRRLLGVERVGRHDDFFELGGTSLMAVRLGSAVRRELGVELPPHVLLEASTPAALARLLGDVPATPGGLHPCLVPLQTAGTRLPLVLVHPAGGHVYLFRALAEALGSDQPVYGLRALGLEAGEEPSGRIEEMAALYLEAVRTVQPRGPYRLGGSSMGGIVAYEMAQRLRAAGEEVAVLALLDTPGPGQMPIPSPAVPERPAAAPASADVDPTVADRLRRVMRANVAAMEAYAPRPYPGRLAFFRAVERRPVDPERPEQPWIDLAEEGTETCIVPGGHETMHAPPHVATLARRLARLLASA